MMIEIGGIIMSKRLNKESFIERANGVHGNIYDYSKVEYVNTKTKVVIVCPEHGDFLQSPEKHMAGQGCPLCSSKKLEETNLKKYGVRRPLQNKEIYKKMETTLLDTYGVTNSSYCEESLKKRKTTNMERYGVPYSCMNEDVSRKREETNMRLYGGKSPFSSSLVKEKALTTIREKYTVDNAMQSEEVKQTFVATCRDKYGVDYPLSCAEVQAKKNATMLERYGGLSPFVDASIRKKSQDTFLLKYGVTNGMHLESIRNKVNDAKKLHHTYNTSESEEMLYRWLVEVFGESDVVRQYSSERYPFACDFYINSLDLFIELNATWTHGNHWFDQNNKEDMDLLSVCQSKNTVYYDNAVSNWSELDVRKRSCAANAQLNYVVFWDSKLRDATLWFAMGCPIGNDWQRMYSWLPLIDGFFMNKPVSFTGSSTNLSLWAKYYQFDVFYKHEMNLWKSNGVYNNVSLQIYLFYNRLVHLNKLPFDLSSVEILRAFTISGYRKGYSRFDVSLMNQCFTKYNFKSVYDPCAGWGERLLYCYAKNIDYFGIDINDGLCAGYNRIVDDFCLTHQHFICQDASSYVPKCIADVVFTCPPYWNLEHYSDVGAECLSYDDFLLWWSKVVENSLNTGANYFCFQINQSYKDDMVSIVESFGFDLCDVFEEDRNSHESHFMKKNGKHLKQNYDSLCVLKKREDL